MKKIFFTICATIIMGIPAFAQPSELLTARAKAEFEKQNFALCVEEMSRIILAQPKNDAALVERARCLYLSADDTNDENIILLEISKTILDRSKAQAAASAEVMSRRKNAITDATMAIGINPHNAAAYNIRGLVKSSLGTKDRRESIADFDRAIEIDPTFIKPYFNRGSTKADMSDYDGAVADFRKVIELDPKNIAARDNLSKYKIYLTLTVTSGCVSGDCINGKGTFNFAVGDTYEGDFVNGKREGEGTLRFKNSEVYSGQFTNDSYNGKGKIKYAGEDTYEGDFVNGKREGKGIYTFKNSEVYSGQFANDSYNGKGKTKYLNGDMYEGDYVNANRDGQGTYTYKNGDSYAGEWKNNNQDGNGKSYTKSTNKVEDGIWKDGVLVSSRKVETSTATNNNPNAIFVTENYTNGDKYEGYKVNGFKDGKGTYTYKDGHVFIGEYREGKRNGFGNETFKDGDSYEGNFENGLKQGFGKYTFKRGEFYEGSWVNDKRNGFGKYVNASGVVSEGNWKDGIKDGAIKKTEKNGNVTLQNWTNGKQNGKSIATVYESGKLQFTLEAQYVDDKETGNPKITYLNGNVYEGEWMYGTPYGIGTLTAKNGDAFKGYFGRGKKYGLIEFTPKKGKQITQYYKNDTLTGVFTNGKVNFTNGDIFEGIFKDGLEEGQGKLTTKKETLTGNWKRGLLQGVVTNVAKLTGVTTTNQYKDGVLIAANGANNQNSNTGISTTSVKETVSLLKETLSGKFDIMEGAPLQYKLTNIKTKETLRYKIEFSDDGNEIIAFKWKELTKNEQSEKFVIKSMALVSGVKYVNFFTIKSGPIQPAAVMFILSKNQYEYLKNNKEIKIDLGNGVQRMSFNYSLTASITRGYTNKNLKVLHYQSDDGKTKMQILDDPICPLIVKIETLDYILEL